MSEKIKKFIDCLMPVSTCNLRCHYCYITLCRKFDDFLPKFKYSPEHYGKALSKKRLGGTCCINMCGLGETLLPPEMPEIIRSILKQGHYVMIVTNGTHTKAFQKIATIERDLLKRLFFKFSFQYLELKRTNQMEKFFSNINLVKDCGCSFTLELTPNDELIPHIEDVKKIAIQYVRALPHVTVARDTTKPDLPILTKLPSKKYKKIWQQFKSKMFDYKFKMFNKKITDYCYGGSWTYFLDFGTGELKQCYLGETLQNIFDDIDSPIISNPVGACCKEPHCYNCHAWLTWGAIPNHKSPTYADMRNRTCIDGSEWLSSDTKKFFSQKLKSNNKQIIFWKRHKKFVQNIFSIRNEYKNNIKRKITTILGLKISIKVKNSDTCIS